MIIDFHAHILPGADHGSDGIDMSLSQLGMAQSAGIDDVVATPHFYPHKETVAAFLRRRDSAQRQLSRALADGKYPNVHIGAEVFLCEGLEHMENISSLCVDGGETILIEMPPVKWPPRLIDTLRQLEDERGLTVVLAHIDRYDPDEIRKLTDCGFRAQINLESIVRPFFGKKLMSFVSSGAVAALGSDIHGTESDVYRLFGKAQRKMGESFCRIMEQSSELILEKKGANI